MPGLSHGDETGGPAHRWDRGRRLSSPRSLARRQRSLRGGPRGGGQTRAPGSRGGPGPGCPRRTRSDFTRTITTTITITITITVDGRRLDIPTDARPEDGLDASDTVDALGTKPGHHRRSHRAHEPGRHRHGRHGGRDPAGVDPRGRRGTGRPHGLTDRPTDRLMGVWRCTRLPIASGRNIDPADSVGVA